MKKSKEKSGKTTKAEYKKLLLQGEEIFDQIRPEFEGIEEKYANSKLSHSLQSSVEKVFLALAIYERGRLEKNPIKKVSKKAKKNFYIKQVKRDHSGVTFGKPLFLRHSIKEAIEVFNSLSNVLKDCCWVVDSENNLQYPIGI